jgi:hypothetical protein
MNLVRDSSRIWSVVFTVVWDASRIFFVSTKKRTKTTKMRACELQSMPIFYLSPMHVTMLGFTVGGALVLQLL